MQNLLERMAKKIFTTNEDIDSGEFANRAALRMRFKKDESRVLKAELAKAKLITFWGPGKSRISPSPSLNRPSINEDIGKFMNLFKRKTQ